MPENLKTFLDSGLRLLPGVGLAVLGGIVAQLYRPRDQFSWWWLLVGALAAAFVGCVVGLFLEPAAFPGSIKCAIAATSGYASRDVLFIIKRRFIRHLKKELP